MTGSRCNRLIAFIHARPSAWKRGLREQRDAAKPSISRFDLRRVNSSGSLNRSKDEQNRSG